MLKLYQSPVFVFVYVEAPRWGRLYDRTKRCILNSQWQTPAPNAPPPSRSPKVISPSMTKFHQCSMERKSQFPHPSSAPTAVCKDAWVSVIKPRYIGANAISQAKISFQFIPQKNHLSSTAQKNGGLVAGMQWIMGKNLIPHDHSLSNLQNLWNRFHTLVFWMWILKTLITQTKHMAVEIVTYPLLLKIVKIVCIAITATDSQVV